MKKRLLMLLALLLPGCGSVPVESYRGQGPKLDLAEYFNGPVKAWGQFQDRSGKVVRRFEVDLQGTWDGDTGVLEETFRYDDGSSDERIWTLTRVGPDRYVGTAGDVVGEARGETAGPAFHWRYVLRLPVGEREYEVSMDDWMWLVDADTLINRTRMSKFGVEVGQVTVFFRREGR